MFFAGFANYIMAKITFDVLLVILGDRDTFAVLSGIHSCCSATSSLGLVFNFVLLLFFSAVISHTCLYMTHSN